VSAGSNVEIQEIQAVSLLNILLAVGTESSSPEFHLESTLEGQTCLVAGNEAALTDTLRGLLEIAQRTSGPNHKLTANLATAGGLVTITLSEDSGPAQWSLQFPEIQPSQDGESQIVSGTYRNEQRRKEGDQGCFEYVSFEEEDRLKESGQAEGLLQPASV